MRGRLSLLPGEVSPTSYGGSNNERREVSRGHSTCASREGLNNVRHTLDFRGVTCNESRIPNNGAALVMIGERLKTTGECSAWHLGGTRLYAENATCLTGTGFSQDVEPPYAERHVRWCGRTATQLMGSLLPDHGADVVSSPDLRLILCSSCLIPRSTIQALKEL